MLTRKHFEAVASILRDNQDEVSDVLVHQFADYFAGSNPNFDRSRFLQATWRVSD
jgi:hypothetical protein|tara:strand:- start:360 stop:524 length:165 start_codon:yes stop_codon:yes gene_type:complete